MRLLNRLRHIKTPYGNLEFDRVLSEVESRVSVHEVVQTTNKTPSREQQEPPPSTDTSIRMAFGDLLDATNAHPVATVIMAWQRVEDLLQEIVNAKGINLRRGRNPEQALLDQEIINRQTFEMIRELRRLRNIAAHSVIGDEITREQAARFLFTARALLYIMAGVRAEIAAATAPP